MVKVSPHRSLSIFAYSFWTPEVHPIPWVLKSISENLACQVWCKSAIHNPDTVTLLVSQNSFFYILPNFKFPNLVLVFAMSRFIFPCSPHSPIFVTKKKIRPCSLFTLAYLHFSPYAISWTFDYRRLKMLIERGKKSDYRADNDLIYKGTIVICIRYENCLSFFSRPTTHVAASTLHYYQWWNCYSNHQEE